MLISSTSTGEEANISISAHILQHRLTVMMAQKARMQTSITDTLALQPDVIAPCTDVIDLVNLLFLLCLYGYFYNNLPLV